jgi:alanyl-tRNA synthetase
MIRKIGEICGTAYGETAEIDVAMRVVADHIRTIAFSIADGQLPSNAKAGYVIRRILRRAVRYGYTYLKQNEAFLYKLIPQLIEDMGVAYPELVAQKTLIERVTCEEEESFLRTLETGIKLLDKYLAENQNEKVLNGKIAFELYDTYGFPLDLTELILREKGKSVNIQEFNVEMQKQKERARNAAAVETGDWVIVNEGESTFVGYDLAECETKILRYRKIKQKNEELYQIVLEKTPFYAEMGGQVGDSGRLKPLNDNNDVLEIIDTKKENNLPIHLTKKLPTEIGAKFLAVIDVEKRKATERNHSATHILHEALREVLGKHVEQKGSYVSPESLRFDFSHFQKMTQEEIRKVEHLANQRIRADFRNEEQREISISKAQEMGAMALFGEKYGEKVRVIKFGNSIELCGGTHVHSTGEIGMVRIVSESSIAAGVRRIEAITGEAIENMLDKFHDKMADIQEFIGNANTQDIRSTLKKVFDENAKLHKKVDEFVQKQIAEYAEKLLSKADEKDGITTIKHITHIISAEQVKTLAFQLRNRQPEKLRVIIGSVFEGKPSLTILLSDDLVAAGENAVTLIRDAAKHIQGGGGGQPFFAQAGGKNADGVEKAVNSI